MRSEGGSASLTMYVLDSHAVLAVLGNEAGGPAVRELFRKAAGGASGLWMTTVNLAEVLYRAERERGNEGTAVALALIEELPIRIAEADTAMAIRAAHLKAGLPIALGDCFAIALAQREGAIVVTGDPEFRRAEGLVQIEWLGST